MIAHKVTPKVYTPHPYQVSASKWLIEKSSVANGGGAALFLDMGLGKTSSTLMAFKQLKDAGLARSLLIVAPLRVAQTTWPSEIDKWLDFIDISYVVLHGPKKETLLKKRADVYIINYEGLSWLTSQSWAGADIICFDELTRMKSWSSARVKALRPFLPTFKRRWGLTGTPVPNGLQDIFSQIYMLDLGMRFGRKLTVFQDTYFKPKSIYSYKLVPYDSAPEAIYSKLQSIAFRIDAKDWLTLPKEIHNTIELELPKKLRLQYEILKQEFIVELSEAIVTASSASVLSTKLRQFLSGNVYTDTGTEHVHMVKMNALRELVDDLNGSPVLIGYQYKHEVLMFKKLFPEATFIESTTSQDGLKKIVADWNTGKIPVLFGHPQSIGHGLNLQEACNTMVFYSLDFNLENYLQFIKRVSRQGQKQSTVIIHYLVFKDSIDEYILKILSGKDTLQNALLEFIKH